MANIVYDPGVRTLSGAVGGFVYRQEKDGTWFVSKRPLRNPSRVPTAAQLQQLERFAAASAHCRNLMNDAAVKETYKRLALGSRSGLRAFVIGDILTAPNVKAIDLSHYTGGIGQTIRILATDNVGVARLAIAIRDNTTGTDLETAEVELGEEISPIVEWLYLTTSALPDPSLNHLVDIQVTAYDLAGNETSSVVSATQ